MEQLFTVDNMATQAILDATCGHLSLKDLLQLEEVTPVTGMAVAAHHYQTPTQLSLDTPHLATRLVDPNTGERLCGPVITRAAINLLLDWRGFGDSKVPNQWHRMVATIAARAAHLKELTLAVDFVDKTLRLFFNIEQANLHADSLLTGVTFSHCTQLNIKFQKVDVRLLPNLLKHFPALECLIMSGKRLPAIGVLPEPQRLKKLELSIKYHGDETQLVPGVLPVIINFCGLQQFSLTALQNRREMTSPEALDLVCRLTGVDWMASIETHPPRKLKHIALPCLVPWTMSLLNAMITSRAATSCRSLKLVTLGLADHELHDLPGNGPVARFLRNLTHLEIYASSDTHRGRVSQFLSLTPSLTRLEMNIYRNAIDWHVTPFDGNLQFRQLTQLVLTATSHYKDSTNSSVVTQEWVETVRRNSSPAGLQVTVTFFDWRTGKVEEVDR